MSYVMFKELVQNDYGYDLEFKLEDDEGNPVNLSGATEIKVFIAEKNATKAKVSGTCVVTDAVNGLCKYTVQSGDFNEGEKEYFAEVEVTYTAKVVTARGLRLFVEVEAPETT